jgi:hypothetical protein
MYLHGSSAAFALPPCYKLDLRLVLSGHKLGVSWYTRLEQGQAIVVSAQILESLAKVFDLNPAERHHLFVLAREQVPAESYLLTCTGQSGATSCAGLHDHSRLYLQCPLGYRVLEPDHRHSVFPGFERLPAPERNILRAMFGNPVYRTFFYNYEQEAYKTIALFRSCTRDEKEPWFKDLIGELQQISSELRD